QEVSAGGRVQGLQARLAALRGLADESRSVRPDDGGYRCDQLGRDLSLPRDWFRAEVRRLPEGLRRVEGRQGRRGRGLKTQAASSSRRSEAYAEVTRYRATLHGAAPALQRSFVGQRAGGAWHRPSVDVLCDHQHDPGAPIRAEGRRKIYSDRNWPGR